MLVLPTGRIMSQETVRHLEQPGEFGKYLTPGMTDRWIFQGNRNDTVIVHVTTREFDSVIRLVRSVDGTEQVLTEIDDEGSDGWLCRRLPADGEYTVCVCGFGNNGGGNYTLSLGQFVATAIEFDQVRIGTFHDAGKAWFYFNAEPDSAVTVKTTGNDWQVHDPRGRSIESWQRVVGLEAGGEYLLELGGQAGHRFELELGRPQRLSCETGQELFVHLEREEAAIVEMTGQTAESRVIELSMNGALESQLIYAPLVSTGSRRPDDGEGRPDIAFLPIGSKGQFTRYAVIWGRNGRYQLWLYSAQGAEGTARYRELSTTIQVNQSVNEKLAVGDTRFYRIGLEQGLTTSALLTTDEFDPLIRLFSNKGRQIRSDDDSAEGLNARLQHSAFTSEEVLLSVAAVGNGGGGNFTLGIVTVEARHLELNRKQTGRVSEGATEQWVFSAKQGQTLIFHVASDSGKPKLVLRNAGGIELEAVTSRGDSKNAILLYTFDSTDPCSLWIEVADGQSYSLTAWDAGQVFGGGVPPRSSGGRKTPVRIALAGKQKCGQHHQPDHIEKVPVRRAVFDGIIPFMVVPMPECLGNHKGQKNHSTQYVQGVQKCQSEAHSIDLGGAVITQEMGIDQRFHSKKLADHK
jgi:hypothetical protein